MEVRFSEAPRPIRLIEAVRRYRDASGVSNAYSWYRQRALSSRAVSFGREQVAAFKVGSEWFVEPGDFERALSVLRQEQRAIERATKAYEEGVLDPAPAGVRTTWGSYAVRDEFHLVTRQQSKPYRDGPTWRCNACMQPAATEHGRPECHRCSDWDGCGADCTLSVVRCDGCGTRMGA